MNKTILIDEILQISKWVCPYCEIENEDYCVDHTPGDDIVCNHCEEVTTVE